VLSKYRHIGPRRAGCRSQDRNCASNADGGVVSSPAKPVSHGDPHSRSLAWSWCDSSSLALVMHEAWVVNCNQWQPPIRHLSAHPQKSCESILTAYCLQSSHSGSPKIKQKVAVPITGQPCGGFECGFPGAQNESLFSAQRLTINFTPSVLACENVNLPRIRSNRLDGSLGCLLSRLEPSPSSYFELTKRTGSGMAKSCQPITLISWLPLK
jgi:hypothetical protein